jgi:hypothetical protein
LTSVFYITNWTSLAWVQTLLADFSAGINNGSVATTISGGEVTLAPASANWNSIGSRFGINANGSGDMIDMFFDESHNVLITLQDSTTGNELQVYDASNISNAAPVLLRGKNITQGTSFVVKGDYVIVSADDDGSEGAEIVVVDLFTMATVATIDLPQNAKATALALNGNWLVIGRMSSVSTQEVFYYDITNPVTPALIGSTELGYDVTSIALNHQHVFVVSNANSAELTAIQALTMSILNTLDMPTATDALSVAVDGTTIFVGRASGAGVEFVRLDGSMPENGMPTLSGLELGSSVNKISFNKQKTTLALATSGLTNELVLVDPATLALYQTIDASVAGGGKVAAIYGTNVYFGSDDNSSEILVYGVINAGWSNPQVSSTINQSNPRPGSALFVDGIYAYVGTTSGSSKPEFTIYNISNPSTPTYVGSYLVGSSVNRIIVSGNYAYLATANTSSEVRILNITNKAAPTLISSVNLSGSQAANALALSGTNLYVGVNTSSSPEMYVVNITNPATPSVIGSVNLTGNILDLGIYSTRLYAASTNNSGEIAIVNIATPSAPSVLSLYNASGNQDGAAISIYSSTLALGRLNGTDPEISLLNITSATPSLLGSAQTTGDVVGLSQTDSSALQVATAQTGAQYQRWDISNPASPLLVSIENLGSSGVEIIDKGSTVFVVTSSTTQTLQILGPLTLPNYAHEAIFTSQAYDATSVATWDSLEWTTSGTGTVEFMIRTADSEANLQTAKWVGPLGTSASHYTVSGTAVVTDPAATGKRWIQFQAILSGDGSNAPSLLDVSASYSP